MAFNFFITLEKEKTFSAFFIYECGLQGHPFFLNGYKYFVSIA